MGSEVKCWNELDITSVVDGFLTSINAPTMANDAVSIRRSNKFEPNDLPK